MPLPRTGLLALLAFGLLSCSSAATETSAAMPDPISEEAQASTAEVPNRPSTTRPSITEPSPTSDGERSAAAAAPDLGCVLLTDFSSAEDNARWQTVNDYVMGGQSLGGPKFIDNSLIFSGEINTDGGGFSSLRLLLEPEQLVGLDRVTFRARTDGRPYMVTFDDNVRARDRRVSHRAEIPFADSDDWQIATLDFDELFPAIFGRPIEDTPFQPELATRMGIMISDGQDGPFTLQVDWIQLCPAGTTP